MNYYKLIFAFVFSTALVSCNSRSRSEPVATDSSQVPVTPSTQSETDKLVDGGLNPDAKGTDRKTTDTVDMKTLPKVFNGDVLVQYRDDDFGKRMEVLSGSPFTHAGIIFKRERDGVWMVMEVLDSVRLTPLRQWTARNGGKHTMLLRHKKYAEGLSKEETMRVREASRKFKKCATDDWFAADDKAVCSSELVWKLYNNALNVELAPMRTLKSYERAGEPVQKMLATHYGKNIPFDQKYITPVDFINSPNMVKVYER
ncbi:MAG: YiiX/YebB-like N1pC/P60 family cysteine hydrolase [Bacteroidia bacterium]